MMRPPFRPAGFTLIEVLIALVIAATALALGFGAVRGSAQRLGQVETSTLAAWALDNVANDIELQAATIEPGQHRYEETMLGRTLIVEAEVQRTDKPALLSMELIVTDAAAPGVVLDSAVVRAVMSGTAGGLGDPQPR